MNFTEIAKQLRAVTFALDKVEVRGRENMDILLGSIQIIDRCAASIEKGIKDLEPKKAEPEIKLEMVPSDSDPA